ncbi:DNA packaging protein [Sphingobacterium sp. SGG-5]|uniref:DNA-packaging protein n=1 Tax=Sphingobacterium sp. SGG-5 TaxID=2710881 RepID=UPI0013EAFAD1|nr:DNA-packaging protein [Sphingobacterium sp. SGG-5]NGM63492.1 DNA packaging protein [Sphingobacterium sp. SGG-5]
MAAPIGNQFWKLRSKHGRDKLFETPELLWDAACEYFQWCDDNPLIEIVIEKVKVNGFGDKITKQDLPKMRPYTLHGLCLYLDCSTEYFRHFKQNNKDHKDFMPILTRIEETIYNQKFSGAAAGFLNPNIIARDLGLVDKKENKVSVEQPLFGDDEGGNSQEGA